MKRLLKYVWKYKLLVIIPSVAMLLSIILDMFNPYLSEVFIDKIVKQKQTGILSYVLIALLGIALFRAIFGYIKEYLFDYMSSNVSIDLKEELFNHIEKLPYSYFDSMNTGELMSRIGEDIDNIWRTISFGMRLLIENALYFAIAISMMLYINWKLAIICTVVMLPIAFLAMKLEKQEGVAYDKISDQTALLNTTAQENIAGVRLVKAFGKEKHEISKFLKMNKRNYELNMEQSNIIAKYLPDMEFLTNVSIVMMMTIGGIFVMKGEMTIGQLVAFNGYVWMLIWPMRMLGWLTNMIAQNNASAKKIFKILDIEPLIKNSINPITPEKISGKIDFKNVSFKYNEDYVLKNINLSIKPGQKVAIMGSTGSGKSSLVGLIGRYYDAAEGQVLVDGIDVRDMDLKTLRSNMSVVSQDIFLFSESVLKNITLGNENASTREIKYACENACADEFISQLPDGYESIIGERGIGLSGGQKQRISISRALLRHSPILVLDDATSALDMETEYSLLNNLNKHYNGRTTFIIAHRISAVKNADIIIYIENGEIVEKGTHKELLSKKGKYYEIYQEQFKDFEYIEDEVV